MPGDQVVTLFAGLGQEDLAHLAVALRCYRQALRREYRSLTPGLLQFEQFCSQRVREGQNESIPSFAADGAHGVRMLLLLSFEETGEALGVSASTVKRLVASGQLPAVSIGAARRIHRDDLEAFVDERRSTAAAPAGAGPEQRDQEAA